MTPGHTLRPIAGLTPLHGVAQRPLGRVVRGVEPLPSERQRGAEVLIVSVPQVFRESPGFRKCDGLGEFLL